MLATREMSRSGSAATLAPAHERSWHASHGAWKPRPVFNRELWETRQRYNVAEDLSRRHAKYALKDSWFQGTLWSGQGCSVKGPEQRCGGAYIDHRYTTAADRARDKLRVDGSRWLQTTSAAMARTGSSKTLTHVRPARAGRTGSGPARRCRASPGTRSRP